MQYHLTWLACTYHYICMYVVAVIGRVHASQRGAADKDEEENFSGRKRKTEEVLLSWPSSFLPPPPGIKKSHRKIYLPVCVLFLRRHVQSWFLLLLLLSFFVTSHAAKTFYNNPSILPTLLLFYPSLSLPLLSRHKKCRCLAAMEKLL